MFIKHFKFAFLSIVLFALLTPAVSYAVDQRCWTKLACTSGDEFTRGVFLQSSETVAVCKMANDQNKQPVGFCLAAGTAETKVDFGGKKSFANIGEFIKWIYKYGVAVASILAVVMIIVAGFSWATSGGSPEKITAARKRIGGAMMGLFLAVMSYFILSLVNPYLVNLRMPQVWMINTAGLAPTYCDQLKSKKVSDKQGGPFKIDPATASCGVKYYVEGTNDLTCKGVYCDGQGACVPSVKNLKKSASVCSDKYLSIYYKADTSAQTSFKEGSNLVSYVLAVGEAAIFLRVNPPNWLEESSSETKIVVMCENSGTIYADKFVQFNDKDWYLDAVKYDEGGGELPYYEYLISYDSVSIQQANNGTYKCNDGGTAVGFYIKNELDVDADAGDFNFYLSSVPKDERMLIASRWAGVEGGGWFIPFAIFKDKNRFFELDITVDMLKNIAKNQDSEPKTGIKNKGANSFEVWQSAKDWWSELISSVL